MVEKKERKHLQTHHTHTRMARMQNGANSVESYAYSEFNHILYGPYQEFHMNLEYIWRFAMHRSLTIILQEWHESTTDS